MAVYQYRAKLNPERVLEGTIEAADQRSALHELNRQGYFPISLIPQQAISASQGFPRLGGRIRSQEIILFTSQLADLIDSGLPIYQALNVIAQQTPNTHFQKIISNISSSVRDGSSFSSALGGHPHLFPNLYIGMVRSGEESGTLSKVLKRLHSHLEWSEELKRNIKSALIYPSFVFGVGILSIVVLLAVVIPRLVGLFAEMGQTLPLPTRIIINLSTFVTTYWWILLLLLLGLIAVYFQRKSVPFIAKILDYLKLKTPVFKSIHLKQELGEYARTLSTVLSQKIPMIQALHIGLDTITNHLIRQRMSEVSNSVANGERFHLALSRISLFSPIMINILSVGEEAGRLEGVLNKVADMNQSEVTTATKRFTALIEPVIIFCLAMGLGFIILSIVLPIFQLEVFEF